MRNVAKYVALLLLLLPRATALGAFRQQQMQKLQPHTCEGYSSSGVYVCVWLMLK